MGLSAPGRAITVLLATVIGVVATANLGAWQLRRAAQKIALQQAIESQARTPPLRSTELARGAADAPQQYYRPVRLRGRWIVERNVFLENRQMLGRVGFFLVTPLAIEGTREAVLVQRGWVPRDLRDRTLLPAVPTPSGLVDVEGHIAPPPSRLFQLGAPGTGLIRQNLDLDGFARETGLSLLPMSVQQVDPSGVQGQGAGPGDGLARQWPLPAVDVQKHYGYAFQWFALCALMTGLYVWFQLVRPRWRARCAA